jgi:transposase
VARQLGRVAILFVLAVVSHLRERPRVYRKVVELLVEPGMSINQITKFCRVSEHTVRAVRDREAIPIAERKERLVSILGNVAELAAERMEELAPHATLRDAGMAAGVATDKLLALLGDSGGVPVQINMQVNAQLIQERFNKAAEEIQSRALAEPKAILNSTALPSSEQQLPNGETLPEPPAAMNLQSGTGRRVSKGDRQKRNMTMRAFLPVAVLRIVVPPKGGRRKALKASREKPLSGLSRSDAVH